MGLNVLGFVKCLSGRTQPILGRGGTRIQQAVETFMEAERAEFSPRICHVVQRGVKNNTTVFANMEEISTLCYRDLITKFYK